jgi:hypothetical protein
MSAVNPAGRSLLVPASHLKFPTVSQVLRAHRQIQPRQNLHSRVTVDIDCFSKKCQHHVSLTAVQMEMFKSS